VITASAPNMDKNESISTVRPHKMDTPVIRRNILYINECRPIKMINSMDMFKMGTVATLRDFRSLPEYKLLSGFKLEILDGRCKGRIGIFEGWNGGSCFIIMDGKQKNLRHDRLVRIVGSP
jgi:hypothetical protein